jgi:alginate O-acetyltransferase complex protein AlgJ
MLMTHPRRHLILAVLAVLVAPVIAMPFVPFRAVSLQENRRLAPAPTMPRTAGEWRTLPRVIDAWLADHFGFRDPLMQAAAQLQRRLGGEGAAVAAVTGRKGQMFLVDGLLRSTGQEVDPARAADYAAFVCAAKARLPGVTVVASLAPSPAEIEPDLAPDWAGPAKLPTEYDLILAGLARCGVTTVDLRPALRAARADGQVYRRLDSHWSLRGSLMAYDQVVQAMGQPGWRIDPKALSWGVVALDNGDLPRLAGQPQTLEEVEIHDRTALPPGVARAPIPGLEARSAQPFVIDTGKPGPTVLIVGDSFTADPMPPYFAAHVGKLAWIHEDRCAFDWRVIGRVKPDHVVFLPAAREAVCGGARPAHFN